MINISVNAQPNDTLDLVKSAEQLLYAVKTNKPTAAFETILAAANEELFARQINTDYIKKAFWLNIYNAFIQISLKENPAQYSYRNKFFKAKQIRIAGHAISFDFIEHGILRRSKIKLSLGYLHKPFTTALERRWRVQHADWRIHFALNCGAKSCPPIAFYTPEKLDKQLDLAARAYLSGDVLYNAENNTVTVPALMSWFRADFGGRKGIRRILESLSLIPTGTAPRLIFKKYDWFLALNSYAI